MYVVMLAILQFLISFFPFPAILRDADLEKTSTKAVRQQLEVKLGCDLAARRKEITEIVEKYVADKQESSAESSSESVESEDEKPAPKKIAAKRKKNDSDNDLDEPKKKSASKKKKGSDTDSGVDKKAPVKEKAKAKPNAFTRPFKLSPDLAALMGAESLPRHEVVKKVWAIIKERNLYDPKNKQFAVCDAELQVVMGVKRFRTFGMLKYLKKHFVE